MTAPPALDLAARRARDTRGYWRVLLALAAPTGWLTVGVSNLFTPYSLGGDLTTEMITGIDAHRDRTAALIAVAPLFFFTFVPGVIALIVVCRRAKPLFAAVLGTLGILGALAGTANPQGDLVVLAGLRQGIDHDRLAGLADALGSGVLTWPLVFTLLFITLGRIAIGVLLWTAGVGPRSLAVLMAVSPFVEFGGDALGLGNGAPAASWILSGAAMLGVSAVLLRMPNDEFDLPARG
jgi:hypothetical protein